MIVDNPEQKENILAALKKASTKPDGSMGMASEELDEIADFLKTQSCVDVCPKTGLVRFKKEKN